MPKQLDIYIDAKEQRAFRRRAIAAYHQNKEYMEALFIKRGVGEFHIVQFLKLKLVVQKENEVVPDDDQYESLKADAKRQGYEFGSIHTHIYADTAPSEWDHKAASDEGDALVGVCYVEEKKGKVRTRLDFWQPQMPCRLNLIHSK